MKKFCNLISVEGRRAGRNLISALHKKKVLSLFLLSQRGTRDEKRNLLRKQRTMAERAKFVYDTLHLSTFIRRPEWRKHRFYYHEVEGGGVVCANWEIYFRLDYYFDTFITG